MGTQQSLALRQELYLQQSRKLGALPLTPEEKTRWAPMLRQTWGVLEPDAGTLGRLTKANIVEITCDANRPQEYGGMTELEYAYLSAIYDKPAIQRWLKSLF